MKPYEGGRKKLDENKDAKAMTLAFDFKLIFHLFFT
jgi:hypothetical protein